MKIITKKQAAVLKFIEKFQMKNGKSPTVREMREHFGFRSDNSILKHLNGLVAKKYIQKDNTPRGIKLLQSVKERLMGGIRKLTKIPILGSIPAGGPVLSEENIVEWMTVSEEQVKRPDDCFILVVRGESMKDAGIMDGDLVIADTKKEPRSGDIVIALVDNENTVKRLVKEGGNVYLKPENADYSEIYPTNELQVQGVVIGLIRSY